MVIRGPSYAADPGPISGKTKHIGNKESSLSVPEETFSEAPEHTSFHSHWPKLGHMSKP